MIPKYTFNENSTVVLATREDSGVSGEGRIKLMHRWLRDREGVGVRIYGNAKVILPVSLRTNTTVFQVVVAAKLLCTEEKKQTRQKPIALFSGSNENIKLRVGLRTYPN